MSGTGIKHGLRYPSLAEPVGAQEGLKKQLKHTKDHIRALIDEMRYDHMDVKTV